MYLNESALEGVQDPGAVAVAIAFDQPPPTRTEARRKEGENTTMSCKAVWLR